MFLVISVGAGYLYADIPLFPVSLREMGAVASSLVLVFFLSTAFSGGLLLHPAEIDFVAVAPVSVRRFVLADLLFQSTLYALGLPFLILAAIGYGIRTGAPAWAVLAPVGAVAALGLTAVLTVQTLGIARSLRRPWAVPATIALMVLLLAPAALRFALRLDIGYASLPFPTSAAIGVALAPYGMGDVAGLPVLLAFLAAAVVAHAAMTSRGSVPNLRATFAFAAMFDPAASKRLQAEAFMRLFGRLRRQSSRMYRPTILRTMIQLHFVRMTRDGTLFMVAMISTVFGIVQFGASPGVSVGGIYIATILPVAAVAQWMQTDRPNLWLVAVSGQSPGAFYVGWWVGLAAFTAAVGSLISFLPSLAAPTPDLVGPIGVAGAALGGVALTMVAAAKLPYVPSQLSVRPLLHFLLAGVGAGVGAGLGFAIVLGASLAAGLVFPPAAPLAALAALVPVGWLGYAIVGVGAKNPEM